MILASITVFSLLDGLLRSQLSYFLLINAWISGLIFS